MHGDPSNHGSPWVPEKQPTPVTLIYPVTVNGHQTCPGCVLPYESNGLWLERRVSPCQGEFWEFLAKFLDR